MSLVVRNHFLITHGDGDVRVRRLSETEVISMLDVDEDTGELLHLPYSWEDEFDADPNYWEAGRYLIIRGTVVTPRPASIKYELR